MPNESDQSILNRVQCGEEEALACLYDRHSRLIYSVALRILRDTASAADVLQDVFLDIWWRPERYATAKGDFSGWLTVISRNRSIDMLRRQRPSDSLEDCVLASPFDLAHQAEQNLMCEKARLLKNTLSTEQQEALDMAFFEGMTHSEIAAQIGIPLGTVKSRIRAALSLLRQGFQRQLSILAA